MANPPSTRQYDVVIIGSGPAGWTAAVYATRANLSTLVITGQLSGGIPGGQLMLTTDVENYPGFADGVLGPDLMDQMRLQALRFGPDTVEEDVVRVDFSQQPHVVFTGSGKDETAYFGNTVIIATGAAAQWLGLPSERRLQGRGVSACATCDGFFFKGQEVAVVGGGDTAMEEALFLTRFASKVIVVHRRKTLRASKVLQDHARSNPRIAWAFGREVVEILGDERVKGLKLRNTEEDSEETLPVQGVFIAIGHRPNTDPFKGHVDMDDQGYILASTRTSANIPGVFVAGDVNDRRYRQAVTAAGEGAKAALDAEEFLTGELTPGWSNERIVAESEDVMAVAMTASAENDGDANTAIPDKSNAAEQPGLTIYTTSWCPDCRGAKRYLDGLGISYREIDIEKVPGAAEEVEQWSGGFRTVPTFKINDRIIVDFDRSALDEALASKNGHAAAVGVKR